MSTTATAPRYEIGQQVRISGMPRETFTVLRRRCLVGHWDYQLGFGPTRFLIGWQWESMIEAAS